jgi:hypothetical protein
MQSTACLSVGSRILGVIVNDVPRRKDGYGYGYYSYGSYGNTRKRPTSDLANADAQMLEGRTNGARLPASGSAVPTAAATEDGNGNGAH